jgi:carbamate kinase
VLESGQGAEAVIDKDLAAALLAEQIDADGLVILTDADAVYEHTPMQRPIREATRRRWRLLLATMARWGPAVSSYVRRRASGRGLARVTH